MATEKRECRKIHGRDSAGLSAVGVSSENNGESGPDPVSGQRDVVQKPGVVLLDMDDRLGGSFDEGGLLMELAREGNVHALLAIERAASKGSDDALMALASLARDGDLKTFETSRRLIRGVSRAASGSRIHQFSDHMAAESAEAQLEKDPVAQIGKMLRQRMVVSYAQANKLDDLAWRYLDADLSSSGGDLGRLNTSCFEVLCDLAGKANKQFLMAVATYLRVVPESEGG